MKIKKYSEFLLEYSSYSDTRSKSLEIGEETSIIDVIKEHAPWYMDNIKTLTPIYRGIEGDKYMKSIREYKKALLIKPGEHTRVAKNTDNHYIEMLNNSHYWSDYPKRSESIICTTSEGKASIYGKIYRVIPLVENSTFTVCPDDDVFYSFKYLFKKINELNAENGKFNDKMFAISQFSDWLNYGFGIPVDADVDYIRNRLNLTVGEFQETESENYNPEDHNEDVANFMKKLVNEELHFDDFYETIEEWMSPELNDFNLIHYDGKVRIPDAREVYTDSNCLLILESEFEKELERYEG